jgi:hypothetical protein
MTSPARAEGNQKQQQQPQVCTAAAAPAPALIHTNGRFYFPRLGLRHDRNSVLLLRMALRVLIMYHYCAYARTAAANVLAPSGWLLLTLICRERKVRLNSWLILTESEYSRAS